LINTRNNEEKVSRVAEAIDKFRVGSRVIVTNFPENAEQA